MLAQSQGVYGQAYYFLDSLALELVKLEMVFRIFTGVVGLMMVAILFALMVFSILNKRR